MAFDTSPRVAALQNQLYREIGPAGRARIAAELSDALRELAIAGVRHRNPELDEAGVMKEVLTVFYGSGKNRR